LHAFSRSLTPQGALGFFHSILKLNRCLLCFVVQLVFIANITIGLCLAVDPACAEQLAFRKDRTFDDLYADVIAAAAWAYDSGGKHSSLLLGVMPLFGFRYLKLYFFTVDEGD
jgi:hypothetical protein